MPPKGLPLQTLPLNVGSKRPFVGSVLVQIKKANPYKSISNKK